MISFLTEKTISNLYQPGHTKNFTAAKGRGGGAMQKETMIAVNNK